MCIQYLAAILWRIMSQYIVSIIRTKHISFTLIFKIQQSLHCPSPPSFADSTLQKVVRPQAVFGMTCIVPHLTSPSRLLPFLSCHQRGCHCTVRCRLCLPIPLYKQWCVRKQSSAWHALFLTQRLHSRPPPFLSKPSMRPSLYCPLPPLFRPLHSTNSGASAGCHRHDMHCLLPPTWRILTVPVQRPH